MKRIHLFLGTFLGMVALTPLLWADPPTTVGRLSYLDGSASFAASDGSHAEAAYLNFPLAAGNQLSTSPGSRAEIQVGSSDVLLASDTAVTFEALDNQSVAIRLDRGRASFNVRYLGPDQSFQVDTQAASVSLSAPGEYRIDQSGSGDLRIISWNGEAGVNEGQTSFTVGVGEEADITSSGTQPYQITDAPDPGLWDQWVSERVGREDRYASTQYVPSEMDGSDLDQYGTWNVVAGYGPVWFPTVVAAGWAPYTAGQWVWIEPWGWTWVDNEPWGFAPFHYGRWAMLSGSWAWIPGPFVSHPVYAPALVRWVGGAPWRGHPPGQVGVTWAPLGPREAFHPLYHASTTYYRAVNVPVAQPRYVPRPAYASRSPFGPQPYAPGPFAPPVAARRPWLHWPFARPSPGVVGRPGPGPGPVPASGAGPWHAERPAPGPGPGPAVGAYPDRPRRWPPQGQASGQGQDSPYWLPARPNR